MKKIFKSKASLKTHCQRNKRRMGSLFSSGGSAKDRSSAEETGVRSFHSSENWQLYFNEIKESSKLLVIDFAASWCPPCKFIAPAVHELAAKLKEVSFVKIDVDELPDVAKEFGVEAMLTFVLGKAGKEVDRVVGADKDELEKKVRKHI